MVCNRCIRVLKSELSAAKLNARTIELGRVVITIENEEETKKTVAKVAKANGFPLLENPDEYLDINYNYNTTYCMSVVNL